FHLHGAPIGQLLARRGARPGHWEDLSAPGGSAALRLFGSGLAGPALHHCVRRVDEVRGRADAPPICRGAGPGGSSPAGVRRRYRPVHARRPGDPRSDRGPRSPRAECPAGAEPMDQAPAPGACGDRLRAGQAPRPRNSPSYVQAGRGEAGVVAFGEGPVTKDRVLEESYRFCAAVARREARNFYAAFRLLPASRRRSMCALYAFLRHSDDLADEPGSAPAKARALDDWRQALDAALAGDSGAWPGFPALADTVERFAIPAHLLHAVIQGVSMDIQPRGFATFAELADYCYHVASVVGLSCLHIWGYRSE